MRIVLLRRAESGRDGHPTMPKTRTRMRICENFSNFSKTLRTMIH